jgi:hypothetical protein
MVGFVVQIPIWVARLPRVYFKCDDPGSPKIGEIRDLPIVERQFNRPASNVMFPPFSRIVVPQ